MKWVTVVEGDPKALFLITTTQSCWKGHYPLTGNLHFTFDMYLIMLRLFPRRFKYNYFQSLLRLDLGSIFGFLGYWGTFHQRDDIYIYIYIERERERERINGLLRFQIIN